MENTIEITYNVVWKLLWAFENVRVDIKMSVLRGIPVPTLHSALRESKDDSVRVSLSIEDRRIIARFNGRSLGISPSEVVNLLDKGEVVEDGRVIVDSEMHDKMLDIRQELIGNSIGPVLYVPHKRYMVAVNEVETNSYDYDSREDMATAMQKYNLDISPEALSEIDFLSLRKKFLEAGVSVYLKCIPRHYPLSSVSLLYHAVEQNEIARAEQEPAAETDIEVIHQFIMQYGEMADKASITMPVLQTDTREES